QHVRRPLPLFARLGNCRAQSHAGGGKGRRRLRLQTPRLVLVASPAKRRGLQSASAPSWSLAPLLKAHRTRSRITSPPAQAGVSAPGNAGTPSQNGSPASDRCRLRRNLRTTFGGFDLA